MSDLQGATLGLLLGIGAIVAQRGIRALWRRLRARRQREGASIISLAEARRARAARPPPAA